MPYHDRSLHPRLSLSRGSAVSNSLSPVAPRSLAIPLSQSLPLSLSLSFSSPNNFLLFHPLLILAPPLACPPSLSSPGRDCATGRAGADSQRATSRVTGVRPHHRRAQWHAERQGCPDVCSMLGRVTRAGGEPQVKHSACLLLVDPDGDTTPRRVRRENMTDTKKGNIAKAQY